MAKRRLPTGVQTFREIREDNCYYVDKTGYALRLIRDGKSYFLSRPHRLRQEPLRGHVEGAFRGSSEPVRGLGGSRPLGLVRALSGGAT